MIEKLGKALCLSYVPRWVIVPMLRDQNVADHSWRVAIIAYRLATVLGLDNKDRDDITIVAMWHDLDEVHTGDTPATEKSRPIFNNMDVKAVIVKMADYMESLSWVEKWAHPDVRDGIAQALRVNLATAQWSLRERVTADVADVCVKIMKEIT